MHPEPIPDAIRGLERPHPALWTYYIIRAVLTGPGLIAALPYLYFRYHTLHYRFDEEGIHMKVGILFRREVNLTYSRIQARKSPWSWAKFWAKPGPCGTALNTASPSSPERSQGEGEPQKEAL